MILVAGATGLVGNEVCQTLDQFGIQLTSVDEYARRVLGGQAAA